ncbi:MAG: hypothetical protein EA379_02195 [Phycisphaerales bacterium]|nr:MAG: hypothetical protein EA379_02195 [Phycisphaerales bacterium]
MNITNGAAWAAASLCVVALFACGLMGPRLATAYTAPSAPPGGHAASSTFGPNGASLGPGFLSVRVGPFRLLTDAPGDRLAEYAQVLHRLVSAFEHEMRELGVDARSPETPLVCIVFASVEGFERFAREHDGVDAGAMGGYYSARANHAVLFDELGSPESLTALRSIAHTRALAYEAMRRAAHSSDAGLAARLRDWATRSLAEADSEEERLQRDALRTTLRRLAHEGVHLLAYNTGVMDRAPEPTTRHGVASGPSHPAWLCEGMAESIARRLVEDTIPFDGLLEEIDRGLSFLDTETPPLGCAAQAYGFYAHSAALYEALRLGRPGSLAAMIVDPESGASALRDLAFGGGGLRAVVAAAAGGDGAGVLAEVALDAVAD